MPQTAVRHPRAPGRWGLAALACAMLLPSLATSIANVALPSLAGDVAAPFAQVQWVVLAYLLAMTTLIVGAGRLGDLVGRRRLLLAGMALFTAASAACAAAPSLGLVIAARAVQGLGAAVVMALSVAFAADVVPKGRTGSAMGVLGAMSAVGTALGPSLGGVLVASWGWRAVFWLLVPLGAVALLLAGRALPSVRAADPEPRERFDLPGTVILAATLAAYSLAMNGEPALLPAAVCGVAAFVAVERRAAAPLIRLALLQDAGLGGGLLASALVAAVVMTTLVVGPFYLTRALGLGMAAAGAVMTVGPAVAAVVGMPAGRAVDRFGGRITALAGLVGIGAGALFLGLGPASAGVAGYVGGLGVLTAGYALFQAANNTATLARAGQGQRGVVSAMLTLSRNLGLITGASTMAGLFASTGTAAEGMRLTFLVATGLVAVALAVVARSGRVAVAVA